MRYFKGIILFGLHITRSSSFSLHDFTDVDWTDNVYDHKSTDDYLVFFGHTPTSWKSGNHHGSQGNNMLSLVLLLKMSIKP